VLFADLKGSMELLADRDPEEARKILDPVLERMMEAVHRYEGTVNQVMGDGIMALFGAPLALEDHAVRACYAALAMQSSIHSYSEELLRTRGLAVRIRVGLNSGEVVVRAIGSDLHMDYSAVGQTTHLAARLEQLADPGTTLLSDPTLSLVEGFLAVKARGPVPIKGLAEPVRVYELIGAGLARTRLQAAATRGLTRFVGRSAELAQMFSALERSHAGHGQAVALVGEPGVGKSRLVWEFTRSHRTQGWLVLESASMSYGKASAYRPVIDLLKSYFQIEGRDDARRIREKATGKLITLDRALEPHLVPLLALLDVTVDDERWVSLDPVQKRLRTLEACKRLILRESQVQPLVVVFEDLHWIDNETQALLDSLVESLPTARLMLLVNFRPEYQPRWTSKTYYTQLRVDPLTDESAEELLRTLLGTDPSVQPLARLLIEHTEGNPLYVEESVRALVETGELQGRVGAYRLAARLTSIQVPATVQSILAARIDRLGPEDKQLLQAAAVIGNDVPYRLLQAVVELPEDALRERLSTLQAAEFLYEKSLFPDLEYTFKHALTHEVAYGSVLQERRQALHTRIMESIERLYADRLTEQVERLGYHARQGQMWQQAVQYLRQAGLKALSRFANREASTWFDQALDSLHHLPAEDKSNSECAVDLRLELRTALVPLGEVPKVFDHLIEAERISSSTGDQKRLATIASFLGQWFFLKGEYARALEAGQRALEGTTTPSDDVYRVNTRFVLGQVHTHQGAYRVGIECFEKSIAEIERLHLPEGFDRGFDRWFMVGAGARAWAGRCHAQLGDLREALALCEDALRIAERVNHPFARVDASRELAVIHLTRGDWHKAISLLEPSLELCRTFELRLLFPGALNQLGRACIGAEQIDRGIQLLEQGRQAADSVQLGTVESYNLWQLAVAYSLVGRTQDAMTLADGALALVKQRKERGVEAWVLRLHGQLAANDPNTPDLDRAEHYYRLSWHLATELGMRPLVASCHLSLGTLYKRTSQREQRHEHLRTAKRMYQEMGMQFWLDKADAALTQL
jgi:class 3 adenylate cyclase/tetratricopeptide (TPR) repeat protein